MLVNYPLMLVRGNNISFRSNVGKSSILYYSEVGKYTYIADDVYINSANVGNYCSIASGTKIGGSEHAWWWGSTSPRIRKSPSDRRTEIGNDVWIGSNVIIRQGIKIGHGAVVGAGSVVLSDVDAFTLVAGIPAKPLRRRFSEKTAQAILETQFWNLEPNDAFKLLNEIDYSETDKCNESS